MTFFETNHELKKIVKMRVKSAKPGSRYQSDILNILEEQINQLFDIGFGKKGVIEIINKEFNIDINYKTFYSWYFKKQSQPKPQLPQPHQEKTIKTATEQKEEPTNTELPQKPETQNKAKTDNKENIKEKIVKEINIKSKIEYPLLTFRTAEGKREIKKILDKKQRAIIRVSDYYIKVQKDSELPKEYRGKELPKLIDDVKIWEHGIARKRTYRNEIYYKKKFGNISLLDEKLLFAEDEVLQRHISFWSDARKHDERLCSIEDPTTKKRYGIAFVPDEFISGKFNKYLKPLLDIYWEEDDLRPFYKKIMDEDNEFRELYFKKYYVGFATNVDPAKETDYMTWVEKMEYYERKKQLSNV